MVFATPGKTLPNARFWTPATVMGDCTEAVAVMLPFTPCARTVVPATSARTSVASAALEAVYMWRLPLSIVWYGTYSHEARAPRLLYPRNRQRACHSAYFLDDRQCFVQSVQCPLYQDRKAVSLRPHRDCHDI